MVAQGKLASEGNFVASEVLAKHDENYMPPEAAKAVGDATTGPPRSGPPRKPGPPPCRQSRERLTKP